jgi:hypothetical protein
MPSDRQPEPTGDDAGDEAAPSRLDDLMMEKTK